MSSGTPHRSRASATGSATWNGSMSTLSGQDATIPRRRGTGEFFRSTRMAPANAGEGEALRHPRERIDGAGLVERRHPAPRVDLKPFDRRGRIAAQHTAFRETGHAGNGHPALYPQPVANPTSRTRLTYCVVRVVRACSTPDEDSGRAGTRPSRRSVSSTRPAGEPERARRCARSAGRRTRDRRLPPARAPRSRHRSPESGAPSRAARRRSAHTGPPW